MHRLRLASPKAALWLAATVVALSLPLAAPTLGHAEGIEGVANYNSEECSGNIKAGSPENAEIEEGTAIQYSFSCNGPITGYQIESQLPIIGSTSAPLATNGNGEPLADALSCATEIPGYAVNCVGTQGTTAAYQALTGEFFIASRLCQQPREDALLTVTYAYLEKGVITQAISGPYDLGHPQGCPAAKHGGKERLELEPVQEAEQAAQKAEEAEKKAIKKAEEKASKKAEQGKHKKTKSHGAKGKSSRRG